MTTLPPLRDRSLLVRLEHALRHRLVAQLLDRLQHLLLLVGRDLAERFRPVEIVAHHLDDHRTVQKRDHAAIPICIGLDIGLGLELLEIALRLPSCTG